MSIFLPQTARRLAAFFSEVCELWDKASDEKRAEFLINPDEPVVLSVPNQEWFDGDYGPYGDGDDDEPERIYFHVESIGGGGDVDEDGEDCGHKGAHIAGMGIDQRVFLFNGRRLSGK